jgi:hypothetical protein
MRKEYDMAYPSLSGAIEGFLLSITDAYRKASGSSLSGQHLSMIGVNFQASRSYSNRSFIFGLGPVAGMGIIILSGRGNSHLNLL